MRRRKEGWGEKKITNEGEKSEMVEDEGRGEVMIRRGAKCGEGEAGGGR